MTNKKSIAEIKRAAREKKVVVIRKRKKIVAPVPAPAKAKDSVPAKNPAKAKVKVPAPAKTKAKTPAPAPSKTAKKKYKPKYDFEFSKTVLIRMKKILPKKIPYQLGIDKILFQHLLALYPGERTKLRSAIKYHMNRITESYSYIATMAKSSCRYGIDCKVYPLDPIHKKQCKRRLHEIRQALARDKKRYRRLTAKAKQN